MSVELLRKRFAAYLDTTYLPPGRKTRLALGAALAGLGVFLLCLCAVLGEWQAAGIGVILLAVGAHRLYVGFRPLSLYRRVRRVVERGVPVRAYVVQANEHLFVPGVHNLAALVLFSFEPLGNDGLFMSDLARRVVALKGSSPSDPELAHLARRITSEVAKLYYRERLPAPLTGGATVYMGDLYLWRARLENRYLDRAMLHCLAEPGDAGGIEMIPDWLLEEAARSTRTAEPRDLRQAPGSRN